MPISANLAKAHNRGGVSSDCHLQTRDHRQASSAKFRELLRGTQLHDEAKATNFSHDPRRATLRKLPVQGPLQAYSRPARLCPAHTVVALVLLTSRQGKKAYVWHAVGRLRTMC